MDWWVNIKQLFTDFLELVAGVLTEDSRLDCCDKIDFAGDAEYSLCYYKIRMQIYYK